MDNTSNQLPPATAIDARDITEQKEAEKALRLAHSDLELLVEKRTVQLADANRKLEQDISDRETIESELIRRNSDLTELNSKFSKAQEQLVQSEKLASIGQLAAGDDINLEIDTMARYAARLIETR